MGEFRQTASIFLSTLTLSVVGLSWGAQAQNSPFAKKGKQAWETNVPADDTQPTAPVQVQQQSYQYQYEYPVTSTATAPGTYQARTTARPASAPSSYPQTQYSPAPAPKPKAHHSTETQPSHSMQTQNSYGGYYGANNTAAKPSGGSATQTPMAGSSYDYPNYNRTQSQQPVLRGAPSQAAGTYYPGRSNPGGQMQSESNYQTGYQNTYQGVQAQQQPGSYYGPQANAQTPYPAPPSQNQKQGWGDKMGFGNLAFNYEGYLKAGAAATNRDGLLGTNSWGEDFVLDGSLRGEVSAITQGGLEYGAVVELRGQYDKYRRGFGGRVGDCPASLLGCNSVNIAGTDYALRGHTSRFYAAGPDDAKDFEAQVEGAHLFLRSAYGDVTVGRDDGAAYLFSLGAPSLLNVGASNNSVDYTGLDAVKTINDASGFSEKVTYTSPRLLGDTVGVGVQLGASYALDAKACGVDYCVRDNDDEPAGVLAPDLDDVIEVGLALDRKFDNGFSVEATATYAMGSEQSTIAAFDDLKSLGLAMELGYLDWTLGGSYLQSNNGLVNGDYEAMDIGLTWQPSKLGFTVGYGHATDENVGLTSDQAVIGVSYDYNENFRIGAGAQYVNRDVNVNTAGVVSGQNENATALFVEGRFTF